MLTGGPVEEVAVLGHHGNRPVVGGRRPELLLELPAQSGLANARHALHDGGDAFGTGLRCCHGVVQEGEFAGAAHEDRRAGAVATTIIVAQSGFDAIGNLHGTARRSQNKRQCSRVPWRGPF